MTYDARQIANWLFRRARADNRSLSIMSLLKLTYIAHGWHLEMRKTPLFSNRIEAWQYGPVIPDVYKALREQGITVTREAQGFYSNLDGNTENLLEQVYDLYAGLSAFRLSDLTHESGGPWHIATQMSGYHAPIPNDLIQKHYEMKRMQNAH
ncbi:MAG: DUF4065 domain-containing protein [Rhodobacteraceae bacterium]|nr:DUF4065 domain-containing protein [Paracoccaceae bacterium]